MFYVLLYLAKPRVITSPIGGSLLQNTSQSLSCSSFGYPAPNITWTFNSNIITSSNNQTTLVLNAATLNQTGNYQCIFQNAAGTTASAIAHLVVYSKLLMQLIYFIYTLKYQIFLYN